MEIEPVETVNEIVEELVDVEDNLDDTEDSMREETVVIVERLKKIIVEKKPCEGIIFKTVGRKSLKAEVDIVNEAVKYLDSNSITETV